MASKEAEGWFGLLAALLLVVAAGAAVTVWGYQLLIFAKHGYWLAFSANDGLHWLTNDPWFLSPTNWLGVHKVLAWVNAGVAVLLACVGALLFAAGLFDLSK